MPIYLPISNIYKTNELSKKSTCAKITQLATDLIAVSKPREKDKLIKIVTNLLTL